MKSNDLTQALVANVFGVEAPFWRFRRQKRPWRRRGGHFEWKFTVSRASAEEQNIMDCIEMRRRRPAPVLKIQCFLFALPASPLSPFQHKRNIKDLFLVSAAKILWG